MDMTKRSETFEELLSQVKTIAKEVAAPNAPDVDSKARFPTETIDALKRAGVLSAPIPAAYGGLGCTMRELALLCSTLSGACGSSGMVLAMHFIQVACIMRHANGLSLIHI